MITHRRMHDKGQRGQPSPSPLTGEGRGEGDDAPHDGATPHPQPLSRKGRGETDSRPSSHQRRGETLALLSNGAVAATRFLGSRRLKEAVRDPRQLCELLDLPAELVPAAIRAAEQFPLFVPRPYLDRIERGNPHDPLLRQVLPLADELSRRRSSRTIRSAIWRPSKRRACCRNIRAGYCSITTGACAVHCRYCFRRHFPYSSAAQNTAGATGKRSLPVEGLGGFHLARPGNRPSTRSRPTTSCTK